MLDGSGLLMLDFSERDQRATVFCRTGLFVGISILFVTSCAATPRSVCRLEDTDRSQEWGRSVLISRNDPRGNPDISFAPQSVRFLTAETFPEGYILRYSALHKETGKQLNLYVRMHTESCTYSAGGG